MSNEVNGNLWALKYREHMNKSRELLKKSENPDYTAKQKLAIIDLANVEMRIACFCQISANAHYGL